MLSLLDTPGRARRASGAALLVLFAAWPACGGTGTMASTSSGSSTGEASSSGATSSSGVGGATSSSSGSGGATSSSGVGGAAASSGVGGAASSSGVGGAASSSSGSGGAGGVSVPGGSLQWVTPFPQSSQAILGFNLSSLSTDAAGAIKLTGFFSTGPMTLGSATLTTPGSWFAGFDAAASPLWLTAPPPPLGVATASVNASGRLIGAGADGSVPPSMGHHGAVTAVSPGGSVLWTKVFGTGTANVQLADVADDDAGNVYILDLVNSGVADFGAGPQTPGVRYLEKYDPAGNFLWQHQVGTARMHVDGAGGILLQSLLSGGEDLGCGVPDAIIAKLDSSGACVWAKHLPVNGIAALGRHGEVLVGTTFTGALDMGCGPSTSNGTSLALTRYAAASGACLWTSVLGDPGLHVLSGPSSVPTGNGEWLVSMVFTGTIDFGARPVTAAYARGHALSFKLDSAGALRWSVHFPHFGPPVLSGDPGGGMLVAFTRYLDYDVGMIPGPMLSNDLYLARFAP